MIRVLIAIFLFSAMPAHAHHSRANFDSDKTVTITGTLVDFAWKNPHIYLEVEAPDDAGQIQSWLIEAHSVTGMRRNGWSADTLLEGQMVTVSGQPDRTPSKHFILMDYVEKPDGERMFAFGNRNADQEPKTIEASADFSGTWGLDMRRFNIRLAGGAPPDDWPYTDAGREQADAYSPNDNPELDCKAIGVPRIIIYPYALNIERSGDKILMLKEHLNEQREILLAPKLADFIGQSATSVGFSIGIFKDRQLRIWTSNFTPTIWGVSNGIDSSASKMVEEVYDLSEDGTVIDFSITLTDPAYFTEPILQTGRLLKEANRDFAEIACDPEAASRHLTVE